MARYDIKPVVWLVRDRESVKFHVENDDYFGTIATLLDLIRQRMKNDAATEQAFQNLKSDLMFLQENYKIEKK